MIKTYIYLPDQLNSAIDTTAIIQRKPKAAVIREALVEGLKHVQAQKQKEESILLALSDIANRFRDRVTGPKDLSNNLDKYLWEGE